MKSVKVGEQLETGVNFGTTLDVMRKLKVCASACANTLSMADKKAAFANFADKYAPNIKKVSDAGAGD